MQTAPRSSGAREIEQTALYVSDFYGKSVFRYVRNSDGTLVTPAGSSLVLSYNPGPIALGPSGNLYVADEQNESVEVYRKGATGSDQPIRTLVVPFAPSSVAVDRAGNEFVGGFSNGYVAVYAPRAGGPAKTVERIALPDRHDDINGVAIDASGDLYVSDTNEVSEFSTPTTNPTLKRAIVGSGQQSSPTGMAPNSRTGELYVANAGDSNILAYSRSKRNELAQPYDFVEGSSADRAGRGRDKRLNALLDERQQRPRSAVGLRTRRCQRKAETRAGRQRPLPRSSHWLSARPIARPE